MTATQPPALLQAQLESMRSLLTECHDYLKPVHAQFMRAEKHEEEIHRVGSDLFKRISCALGGQVEPECSCPSGDGSLRYPCPAHGRPAHDELIVYRAVNRFGSACHFGVESLARVWAGANGSVERVALKPLPELSVIAIAPAQTALVNHVTDGGRNPRYEGLFEGETEQQRTERLASSQAATQPEQRGLVEMIDAAMIEMRNIAPPLCRSECDQLRAGVDRLRAFANEIVSGAFQGGSFDGGDIQNMGVKHGLLRIEQRENECDEVCACREYGFPTECYHKTELLRAVMTAKETL